MALSLIAIHEASTAQPLIQNREPKATVSFNDASVKWFFVLASLPARLLLAALWIYQRTISPVLPVIFGPACGCRFAPTCSHYATEAVRTHGAWAGAGLTLLRLVKCTPLHPGGFDPVPAARPKFSCVAIAKTIPVGR
jgi:putative membrane protein insertion efficiency factor